MKTKLFTVILSAILLQSCMANNIYRVRLDNNLVVDVQSEQADLQEGQLVEIVRGDGKQSDWRMDTSGLFIGDTTITLALGGTLYYKKGRIQR